MLKIEANQQIIRNVKQQYNQQVLVSAAEEIRTGQEGGGSKPEVNTSEPTDTHFTSLLTADFALRITLNFFHFAKV